MKFHKVSVKEHSHKTLISGVNMETFFIRKHMALRLKKKKKKRLSLTARNKAMK